jgi:hypothetical protein
LRTRFDAAPFTRVLARAVPTGVAAAFAQPLIGVPWFVRHVLLDRWFLRAGEAPLTPH